MQTLKEYCLNSTVHGLKFIAESNRHWTERLFWLGCVVSSWFCCWLLISASLSAFQTSAISFVVETNYLNWNISFPTVFICEKSNETRISDFTTKHPEYKSLEYILRLLFNFKSDFTDVNSMCLKRKDRQSVLCPTKNYSWIVKQIGKKCEDLFVSCYWRNKPFKCCKYFIQMETEIGSCYGLNSMQTVSKANIDMSINQNLGPSILQVDLSSNVLMSLHSKYDLPTLSTQPTDSADLSIGQEKLMKFFMKDIYNDPEVGDLSESQRNCRFPDENAGITVHKLYSFTSCLVECRKRAQLKYCNCTSFKMPNTDEEIKCDFNGMNCLNKQGTNITILKSSWSDKNGLYCACLQGCEEIEFEIFSSKLRNINKKVARFSLILDHYPSERFRRNVVRGKLDLVVATGGAAGLLLGASLLSAVEILYYFTLRAYNNYRMEKEKQPKSKKIRTEITSNLRLY